VLRLLQRRIPQVEPILAQVGRSRMHEGRLARITRQHESAEDMCFPAHTADFTLTRAQMRRMSIEELLTHVTGLAQQLASQQSELMFDRIREATESTGNVVSTRQLGAKEAFLEMERRVLTDFDPETLQPRNMFIVVHPSQAEKLIRLATEWEKDPEFVAERERIRQVKIEEWRAREDSRKLVD